MKLEMKHITPYLIYNLPFVCYMMHDEEKKENPIYDVVAGVDIMSASMAGIIVTSTENYVSGKGGNFRPLKEITPILRPLKEYKDIPEIMDNFAEYFEDQFQTSFGMGALNRFDHISHSMAELMFKHHLDLFQLIDQDLALDVNTIKK